jgi:exosortase H (IPTLxxWG-CTERM-specific)
MRRFVAVVRELWGRPDARFVLLFMGILAVCFSVLALRPVNDAVVVPYTEMVARVSGAALTLLGEEMTIDGCDLSSPRFAITIYNGCNGLITSLIYVAGVLAFPAGPRDKLIGLGFGLVAIQLVNLVRIVSLFYIGVYLPRFFSQAHVFVWQTLVILAGVALWVVWAQRWGGPVGRAGVE